MSYITSTEQSLFLSELPDGPIGIVDQNCVSLHYYTFWLSKKTNKKQNDNTDTSTSVTFDLDITSGSKHLVEQISLIDSYFGTIYVVCGGETFLIYDIYLYDIWHCFSSSLTLWLWTQFMTKITFVIELTLWRCTSGIFKRWLKSNINS